VYQKSEQENSGKKFFYFLSHVEPEPNFTTFKTQQGLIQNMSANVSDSTKVHLYSVMLARDHSGKMQWV
jgi:hypothetical protein